MHALSYFAQNNHFHSTLSRKGSLEDGRPTRQLVQLLGQLVGVEAFAAANNVAGVADRRGLERRGHRGGVPVGWFADGRADRAEVGVSVERKWADNELDQILGNSLADDLLDQLGRGEWRGGWAHLGAHLADWQIVRVWSRVRPATSADRLAEVAHLRVEVEWGVATESLLDELLHDVLRTWRNNVLDQTANNLVLWGVDVVEDRLGREDRSWRRREDVRADHLLGEGAFDFTEDLWDDRLADQTLDQLQSLWLNGAENLRQDQAGAWAGQNGFQDQWVLGGNAADDLDVADELLN